MSEIHVPTIEAALERLNDGLDVHAWIELWKHGGRTIDTTIAIAFYQSALQDARRELRDLAGMLQEPTIGEMQTPN